MSVLVEWLVFGRPCSKVVDGEEQAVDVRDRQDSCTLRLEQTRVSFAAILSDAEPHQANDSHFGAGDQYWQSHFDDHNEPDRFPHRSVCFPT